MSNVMPIELEDNLKSSTHAGDPIEDRLKISETRPASGLSLPAPMAGRPEGSSLEKVLFDLPCTASATGLEINADATEEQLIEIGRLLDLAGKEQSARMDSLHWSIGDWLLAGKHKSGRKFEDAEAMEIGRWSTESLKKIQYVASRIEKCNRLHFLPFWTHGAIARVKDPEERLRLLELAGREGWTQRQALAEAKNANRAMVPEQTLGSDADGEHAGTSTDAAQNGDVATDSVIRNSAAEGHTEGTTSGGELPEPTVAPQQVDEANEAVEIDDEVPADRSPPATTVSTPAPRQVLARHHTAELVPRQPEFVVIAGKRWKTSNDGKEFDVDYLKRAVDPQALPEFAACLLGVSGPGLLVGIEIMMGWGFSFQTAIIPGTEDRKLQIDENLGLGSVAHVLLVGVRGCLPDLTGHDAVLKQGVSSLEMTLENLAKRWFPTAKREVVG
jgi:hypothetical protein